MLRRQEKGVNVIHEFIVWRRTREDCSQFFKQIMRNESSFRSNAMTGSKRV